MTENHESSASESFSSDEENCYSPKKLGPMKLSDQSSRCDVLKNMSFVIRSAGSTTFDHTSINRKLIEHFTRITKDLSGKVKIYPETMEKYLEKIGNTTFKKLKQVPNVQKGSFLFVTKSLAVTMNIENTRIRLPKAVLFDVCVFTYNNPVFVLTIIDSNTGDRFNCEKYNTFVARGLTETLRRDDNTVSVLNGVLDETSDIQEKLSDFQEKKHFMFKRSTSMKLSRCESLLRSFLASIAICKTFRFWNKECAKPSNVMMSTEEFMCLMDAIDGTVELEKEVCTNLFMVDLICRLSRGYKIHMDVDDGVVPESCLKSITLYAPLLEMSSSNAIRKNIAAYEYIITGKKEGKGTRWTITSSKTTPLVSKNTSTEKTVKDNLHCGTLKVTIKKLIPIMAKFAVFLVFFLFLEEKSASIAFALAKCIPIMYLIVQVFEHWRQTEHNHQCLCLLIGLVCSCIGDAILVWKSQILCLHLGILIFAAAHLSYANAFGLHFDNLKAFVFVTLITTCIFTHFSWNLDTETFWVVIIYTISISTMGWRAIAKVHESCKQTSTKFIIFSTVCFLVCNIILGYEFFISRFYCSHFLSMVTYYSAQLGITLSVPSNVLPEVQFSYIEKEKKYIFKLLVISSITLCCGFSSFRDRKLIAKLIAYFFVNYTTF